MVQDTAKCTTCEARDRATIARARLQTKRIFPGLRVLAIIGALGIAEFAQAQGQPAVDERCRQALALGLDVSGSVDAREYQLQLSGIAAALDAATVQDLLLGDPGGYVAILVYEWSGITHQRILVDWTPLSDRTEIQKVQELLLATTRNLADPGTAIGSALSIGRDHLNHRADCALLTLDISADGIANLGPDPAEARDQLTASGITVNALVIGSDTAASNTGAPGLAELTAYFRRNVITGHQAFVETARGYAQYTAAMTRKLRRELGSISLASSR